jgi:hypothetical protein
MLRRHGSLDIQNVPGIQVGGAEAQAGNR